MKELKTSALNDLRRIIMDKSVISSFTVDGIQKAKYIEIQSDGSIVLGVSKYRFVNRLWRSEVILSISDLCIKLIQIISKKFNDSERKQISSSMFEEVTLSIDKEDYSQAISRLFIAYRLLYCDDLSDMFDDNNVVKTKQQNNQEVVNLSGVLLKDSSGKKVILGADGIFRNVILR